MTVIKGSDEIEKAFKRFKIPSEYGWLFADVKTKKVSEELLKNLSPCYLYYYDHSKYRFKKAFGYVNDGDLKTEFPYDDEFRRRAIRKIHVPFKGYYLNDKVEKTVSFREGEIFNDCMWFSEEDDLLAFAYFYGYYRSELDKVLGEHERLLEKFINIVSWHNSLNF